MGVTSGEKKKWEKKILCSSMISITIPRSHRVHVFFPQCTLMKLTIISNTINLLFPLLTRFPNKQVLMSHSNTVSSIDLGLPLEAKVLSQFFEEDFVPVDYVNALVATSLNANTNSSTNSATISGTSNSLNSSLSLKVLNQRLNSLSFRYNEYTNELSNQFDRTYSKLLKSSIEVVSYSNTGNINSNDFVDNDDPHSVTRLQYQLSTLKTSMYSLLEDLQVTKESINSINPEIDNLPVSKLKELTEIQERIKNVDAAFELLKSLVASSDAVNSQDLNNVKDKLNNKITIAEFGNSLNIIKQSIQEQIEKEMQSIKISSKVTKNDKLVKIIDSMIDMQPLFKSFVHFQVPYSSFVDFLKLQKSNYMNVFEASRE